MNKRLTFLLLTLAWCNLLFAQPGRSLPRGFAKGGGFDYGNTWIDTAATYVKIKVAHNGVYRITPGDLILAGWDTVGTNVANYHLIYRGQEVPMYVDMAGSNWNYIDFYGKLNDGQVDSMLYRNPATTPGGMADGSIQPTKRYSIFSDTSAYFLVETNTPGLRYQDFNNTNYSSFTPEPYFPYTSWLEFPPTTTSYYEYPPALTSFYNNSGGGTYDPLYSLNSDYVTGEGYIGSGFGLPGPLGDWINTPWPANSGNPATISTRVFGKSADAHILRFQVNNVTQILDTFNSVYINTFSFPWSGTLSSNLYLTWSAEGTGQADNNNVVWTNIRYDRLFNMDLRSYLEMEWQKPTDAYFRFVNSDVIADAWVYDLTTNYRCRATVAADTVKVIVPGYAANRNLRVCTDKNIRTPEIVAVNNAKLSSPHHNNANFIIITHKRLESCAQNYYTYRDTCTWNPLEPLVVYVDDIYNEFGYGTPNVLAIKRFCKYALDNWTTPPKYFLLWGKGQVTFRGATDNLVPTWGAPASDWEYVSNFDGQNPSSVPAAAIGRVNVYNNTQGNNWIEKVNLYEHMLWDPTWMKEGVFLGGGSMQDFEQSPIFNFLTNYREQFSNAPFGGNDWFYQRWNNGDTTNSPTLTSNQRINDGVALIHFFGHSSSNIQDVDIQDAGIYQNWNKQPFIVAFGCYGGDFTAWNQSFGERFVLEPGRGCIGYLANSGAGYLGNLGILGNTQYPYFWGSMLGSPVGDILKQANTTFGTSNQDINNRNHVRQMNLQGDPAIWLHMPSKPDLEVNSAGLAFSPSNFSASDTAFTLNVTVYNNGLVTQDSFYLSVRQQLPSGQWVEHANLHCGPVLNQTVFPILIHNTYGTGMAGLNYFDVFVDSTLLVDELSETNNRLTQQVIIPGNSPAILFPYDFAVIDTNHVSLGASAIVMSAEPVVNYIYEISTDYKFLQNVTSSGVVSGTAVYSSWNVPFTLADSEVYYWRVRLENFWPPTWATASFKYIDGKVGWGQSEPPQFLKDGMVRIEMNPTQLQWAFTERQEELHAFFDGGTGNANYRLSTGIFASELSTAPDGIMYTTFSRRTLEPGIQETINGDWAYLDMPGAQNDLIAAIATTPPGDYFFLMSHQNPHVPQWSSAVMQALRNIGCDTVALRTMVEYQRFIILGVKGQTGGAIQLINPNVFDEVNNLWTYDLLTMLTSPHASGSVMSTTIGPSIDWRELIWDWSTVDPFLNEKINVKAFAMRANNTDSLVYDGMTEGTYSLASIDADRFPFMRLEAHATDSVYLTAPQLDDWYVIYDAAPDAAVDPVYNFTFNKDTVLIGAEIQVTCGVRNISSRDMDSLLVRYYVRTADNNIVSLGSPVRYDSLHAGEAMVLSYSFDTYQHNLTGRNAFVIEINPNDDQPELYHFNNLYDHEFLVQPDVVNPILDVTFNGKHLMDGDYVSPTPEILIEINDENPYLAVNDTAYELYFGPGTADFNLQRVFMESNPNIERESASLPDNKARIYFRPDRLENGDYTLKVMGYDHQSNQSGRVEYRITFNVENESAVTRVVNYPNPFSTSTRFAYLLTGAEIPEVFELHIYTISGKMVKVIDLAEMNDVNYGYNLTEYSWDGRDEYGDLLANGVYIYRVVAKVNGEEMKLRDEGIDEFFRNGFGKMYIMR